MWQRRLTSRPYPARSESGVSRWSVRGRRPIRTTKVRGDAVIHFEVDPVSRETLVDTSREELVPEFGPNPGHRETDPKVVQFVEDFEQYLRPGGVDVVHRLRIEQNLGNGSIRIFDCGGDVVPEQRSIGEEERSVEPVDQQAGEGLGIRVISNITVCVGSRNPAEERCAG